MWGPIPGWNTGKAIEHIWDQSEGNIFYLSQNFRETGCWAADRASPREGEGTAVRALSPPGSKAGQCHREASLQAPRESSLKARRGTPATAGGVLRSCEEAAAAGTLPPGSPHGLRGKSGSARLPPWGTAACRHQRARAACRAAPAGGDTGRVLGRPQRRPQPRHSHVVSGGNSAALSAPMAKAL